MAANYGVAQQNRRRDDYRVSSEASGGAWFGEEFVASFRAKHGHRSLATRPLTYDIAVGDEFARRRAWYSEQLDRLPVPVARRFEKKLWQPQHIWPLTFELATGAWLRDAGHEIAYEVEFGGLTPDWTVLGPDGLPAAFVEVHTNEPRREVYGRGGAWTGLVHRIAAIPAPYVLTLAAGRGTTAPPDAGTAKRIAHDLRAELLRMRPRAAISTNGYTFHLMADPRTGALLKAPGTLRARFEPPSEIAGVVNAHRLGAAVDAKVKKYAALAAACRVPLIVAAGAHPFTGVELLDVDDLLAGAPTVTVQFNYGDTTIGEKDMRFDRPDRWAMPPQLSALLWIDNRDPFPATLRPNPGVDRPIDALLPAASAATGG